MEGWQRAHIENNLASLVESTTCTPLLWACLLSKGIISMGDYNILEAKLIGGKDSQTMAMYILIVTRQNAFDTIILALLNTSQDVPHRLLLNGYVLNKIDIPQQLAAEIEQVQKTRTRTQRCAPPDFVPRETTNFKHVKNEKHVKNDNGQKTSWFNNWIGESLSLTAVGSAFNTHFGRNTTHVRNDSGQTIYVALTCEENSVYEITSSDRDNFKFRFKDNNERQPQTKTIPPGDEVAFNRENRVDYLNIALDNNRQPKITEIVGILANRSYAVNENGCSRILPYDV